jgi:sugar lactone lactonase YvrE
VIDVEQFTESVAGHGEGPIWDAGESVVRWVDMLAGDILTTQVDTGRTRRTSVGTVAAAMRPRRDGGLVVAVERGFLLIDRDGGRHHLPEVWSDPSVRMNEGGCDPQGRFYCGSMAYEETPGRGALYRLDPDRSVSVVLEDLTVSNGLAWSLDGSTAYHIDSPTQTVRAYAFDADRGALEDGHAVVVIDAADGTPDGLTIDAEGGLWVALWDGGAVRHYSAAGELLEVIPLPARRVTACTFGGVDLDALFITTSRVAVPAGEQPAAGALFVAHPGVRGVPAATFRG